MRFLLLTPGTGHFYCGSCLRDHALGSALRGAGHEVDVLPLYLPLVLEEPTPADTEQQVHMGGINMYLQQKSRFARLLPRFLANWLDEPGLLRWASRRGNMTDTSSLGAMTVSMLRGEDGNQSAELDKLVQWVSASGTQPDVLIISNVMLIGVVRRLKAALGVPVIATMQGESPFLDSLPQPYRDQAWSELRDRAADIDAFVAVSHWYGGLMRERMGLGEADVRIIHNGIDFADFAEAPRPLAERATPTVGYLARMCRDKGVHTAIAAFEHLAKSNRIPGVRLSLVGVQLDEDRALVEKLLRGLGDLRERVDVHPNVSRSEKLALLQTFSVLSVPATYGESFGLYLLEAMAAGVPVVQPAHAAFPEILELTGGGLLCAPDNPEDLAAKLADVLANPDRAQSLADTGRRAVLETFPADRMATRLHDVATMLRP